MIRTLLSSAVIGASTLLTMNVGATDVVFSENFIGIESPQDGGLPQGWTTYGTGNVAQELWQQMFGDKGEAPYYRVAKIAGFDGAWSNSTYHYEAEANEWLVTPPIHISSDSQLLRLTALAYGSAANNRYRVLVSEAGQEQESFKRNPVLNTTLRSTTYEVASKDSYVALNGYAGKDICLAFVNKSQDAGLLGFTDIVIESYYLDVNNLTPMVLPSGSEFNIAASFSVRTPVNVDRFTVTLSTSTGFTETCVIEQTCDISGTRFAVEFPGFKLDESGLDYTLTVTPDFEGAEPTVITGEVSTPISSYEPVAVIEEFTGTWCSNCPRGTAFLNFYHDYFTGHDGKIKAIGIAIHSSSDPMLMEDPSYLNTAYNISGAKGYPSAFFNRTTLGDPSDRNIVEETANTRSYSKINIRKVGYSKGMPLRVDYSVENSYSMKSMNHRVALVVVENDVTGPDEEYYQVNGLAGVSKTAVINTYGEELWPYFRQFAEGEQVILGSQISYNHVARGIYPDYYGEAITSACTALEPVDFNRSIPMPAQVADPANIAVIALLLDGNTGNVLGADEVEAVDFNKDLTAVETVAAAGASVSLAGNTLLVSAESDAEVSIYSVDGRQVLSASVPTGFSTVDCSSLSGVVIVNVRTADGAVSVSKLMM